MLHQFDETRSDSDYADLTIGVPPFYCHRPVEADPSLFANTRVTLGKFAPAGSTLTVSTTEPGGIGALIDAIAPMTPSAMPQQLLAVTFEMTAGGSATEITLSGSVVAQSVSDSLGR